MRKTLVFLSALLASSYCFAEITGIYTYPEGTAGEVQYENQGYFGGDSSMRFSTTTKTLTVSTFTASFADISTFTNVSSHPEGIKIDGYTYNSLTGGYDDASETLNVGSVTSTSAVIQSLTATEATITSATISNLTVLASTITASSATITTLNTSTVTTTNATITNLTNSSGTVTNLRTSTITWADGYQQSSHIINVVDKGAVHDGVTDQDAVLTGIINTASGATVYFPPGDYLIGSGSGMQINTSSVSIVFDPGARLLKTGSGATITVAATSGITVRDVLIRNAWLVNADTNSANAGIIVSPDSSQTVEYLTIENFKIDSFTQYGISGGGVFNHNRILHGQILNNGPLLGQSWVSQAYDVNPVFGSHDFTMQDVFFEQVNTSTTSAESDCAKVQGLTSVSLQDLTFNGGGNATVTGAILILSSNTYLTANNIRLYGPASTGLIVETSVKGVNTLSNFIIDGTLQSSAVLLVGTNNYLTFDKLRIIAPDEDFSCNATGVSHNFLTIKDSIISNMTLLNLETNNYANIENNLFGNAMQINGSSCTIRGNRVYGSTDRSYIIAGNNNVVTLNYTAQSTYGFEINGSSNSVYANTVSTATSGAYLVGAYSNNVVGANFGKVDITDNGTGTIKPDNFGW